MSFSKTFGIDSAKAKKRVRTRTLFMVPILVTIFFLGLLFTELLANWVNFPKGLINAIWITITLAAAIFGWRVGYKKALEIELNKRWILTEKGLELTGIDSQFITWLEATKFQEIENGLRLHSSNKLIFIPNELDGYEQILHVIKNKVNEQ